MNSGGSRLVNRLASIKNSSGVATTIPRSTSKPTHKGGRRLDSTSVSKSSAGHHHDEKRVVLSDGTDVTPRPLLRREGSDLRGGDGSSSLDHGGSRLTSTRASKRPTMAPTTPPDDDLEATRVMLTLDERSPSLSQTSTKERAADTTPRSSNNKKGGSLRLPAARSLTSQQSRSMPTNSEGLDEDHMMEVVYLKETCTITLLHIPGVVVAMDSREKNRVMERNTMYTAVCEGPTRSNRCESHSQTLPAPQKNKENQSVPPSTRDMACTATSFDIHDATNQQDLDDDAMDVSVAPGGRYPATTGGVVGGSRASQAGGDMQQRVNDMVKMSLVARGCLLNVEEGARSSTVTSAGPGAKPSSVATRGQEVEEDPSTAIAKQRVQEIMSSSRLLRSLKLVDLALQQTAHHRDHAKYRDFISIAQVDQALQRRGLLGPHQGGVTSPDRRTSQYAAFSRATATTTASSTIRHVAGEDDGKSGKLPARLTVVRPSTGSVSMAAADPLSAAAAGGGVGTADQASSSVEAPTVTKLWSYSCSESCRREVTALAWSTASTEGRRGSAAQVAHDLLAVGYGEDPTMSAVYQNGQVLLWSLRHVAYPERIITTSAPVTALAFSKCHPHLIAVGMEDSSLAIYDMHRDQDFSTPVLESSGTQGRGHEAIWEIQWVERGSDKTERLFTMSNDGQVLEWNMKKGLTATLVMSLKRQGHTAAILSNHAFGLSLAFVPGDSSLYLIGVEDGVISKCSVAYTEQVMENYTSHTAAVYSLRFSPFWPDVFLSCSADWSVKVWNHRDTTSTQPLLTIQPAELSNVVNDVAWSPFHPTVFSSVTGDGCVYVWDLSRSQLEPVLTVPRETGDAAAAVSGTDQQQQEEGAPRSSGLVRRVTRGQSGEDSNDENNRNAMNKRELLRKQSSGASSTREGGGGKSGGAGGGGGGGSSSLRGSKKNLNLNLPRPVQLTSIAFSETCPVFATGTTSGVVDIYKLSGFGPAVSNKTQGAERLQAILYPKGVPDGKS